MGCWLRDGQQSSIHNNTMPQLNQFGGVFWVLLVLVVFVSADIKSDFDKISKRNARTSALYNSSWPIDHADSARNKFALNSGLYFDKEVLSKNVVLDERHFKIQNVDLFDFAEWGVTRDKDEIYSMVGPRALPSLVKINATTLEIVQSFNLRQSLYTGGMTVLNNGHLYCVLGNRLWRFWNGNLDNSTFIGLPGIDGGLAETNGLIVGTNGFIIIKTWCMNLPEFDLTRATSGVDLLVLQISTTFGILGFLWKSGIIGQLFGNSNRRRSFSSILFQGLFGFVLGVVLSLLLMMVFAGSFVYYLKGPWSPYEAIYGEWRQKFSRISIVDPNSMEVVNCVNLTFDRISVARMALVSDSQQPGVDDLITLGEEFVIRWNYHHSNHSLVIDEDWTERYRERDDGSYSGTGPTILNDIVYFTDNTFPHVFAPLYRFYRKSLIPVTSRKEDGKLKNIYEKMLVMDVNNPGEPGFMFYSPVIVPYASKTKKNTLDACVLVWDNQGRTVQCRDMQTLELLWQQQANNTDCVTVSVRLDPVTGETQTLVYFADYDIAPTTPLQWMRVTVADKTLYKNNTKYLVVANGETGKVIARIAVRTGDNLIFPTMIIPGQNGDVFMSARNHFMRISQV